MKNRSLDGGSIPPSSTIYSDIDQKKLYDVITHLATLDSPDERAKYQGILWHMLIDVGVSVKRDTPIDQSKSISVPNAMAKVIEGLLSALSGQSGDQICAYDPEVFIDFLNAGDRQKSIGWVIETLKAASE